MVIYIMISRKQLFQRIETSLRRSRITALIGPRQCGKTTLARQFVASDSINYFDLEDPASLARLDQPMVALQNLRGLIVIDEVQHRPEIFSVLRVLADRQDVPARFLVLGSASYRLLHQASESLAGRIETVYMGGFSLSEVDVRNDSILWNRGGMPLSYLAQNDEDSFAWRKNFILMLLERDIPQWGFNIPSIMLLRFWTMLAHYHGQIWNAADIGRSLGVSEGSVRRYLNLLTDALVVRQLQPWHANIKKRQVKAPKVYVRDSGLLHQLLGIRSGDDLLGHPKSGASWEGYVIEEALRIIDPDEAYFWATHNGAEIDLVLLKHGKMFGLECKRADAPIMTPSMRSALADLALERIVVVYPGGRRYDLSDKVAVIPLRDMLELEGLFPR